MAELSYYRSASQSSIPVVTPRPSRSSISSTFPLSQVSLVSQLRRTSESTTQPSSVSTSVPLTLPQTPVSSIPSFRSIRNLLPFAPVKASLNPPPSPFQTPKPSFVNFGSLRRITHDRKNSAALARQQEAKEPPVIAIARPSQTFEEEMMARKRSRDTNRSTSDPSPPQRTSEERYVLPLPSPGPPLGDDLSTIIEAENSGISKHIPHLGDVTQCEGDDILADPDLAELLSPNKINGKSPSSNPVTSRLSPSRSHSRSPSHSPSVSTPSFQPVNGNETTLGTSPRLGTIVPSSASRAVVPSSPTRRSASLSRANPARCPPSSLPRLTRSVTNAPPSAKDSAGPLTPSGLRGAPPKRHQPPSPLSSQAHSSQIPSPSSPRGSTDVPPRRLGNSRLATPNRHALSNAAAGHSRLAEPAALLPSASQKSSSSQFSPRSASDPTQQPSLRPGLELGAVLDVNKRRRPHLFNSRRRSMSVEEARLSPTSGSTSPIRPSSSLSNRPPAMEWLGPRTVKAFAAAGLLDGDRDGPNAHASGVGRYTSLRAHGEREDRFVPSRMAFSEAASTSSWGRSGSISRGMTPSEGGGVAWGSPTFSSAPRTAFSGSTAPTSISGTSSHQQQQAALQIMKDKHELETEALLAALSDSQRTTKTLREENFQLRDRIRELEDALDAMRLQVHRFAAGSLLQPQPLSGAFGVRSPHEQDRPSRLPSPLAGQPRPEIPRFHSHSHALANGRLVSSDADSDPGIFSSSRAASPFRRDSPTAVSTPVTIALPRPRRRRASTSSSVFPSLPPNMSLLMLEEAMNDRHVGPPSMPPSPSPSPSSSRSPSPLASASALSQARRASEQCGVGCNASDGEYPDGHESRTHTTRAHHTSPAISPTIASFCMTETPGSPSSLQLQPEHERHLGDMTNLSLYAMSDEEL